jgi:hypothetical protein
MLQLHRQVFCRCGSSGEQFQAGTHVRKPTPRQSDPHFVRRPITFSTIALTSTSVWGRENSRTTSLNAGSSNSYALVFSCICQEACQGRFIVAVDDDTSHPYGVPGQRIGALSMHPSLPD